MSVKQGTTLYLCLEDSTLRIQNRLFEITEDAPANVHFSTESDILGKGLERQLHTFLAEHPDTVLVIIDTLQMIRGTSYDSTYANDYRDLSALKQIADASGIAVLLIHHLRKEPADDVFNRISGTAAISGAVDSSFILVEDRRGSGRAKLSCIGRDIEYRELMLERNAENVWEMITDSKSQPELLGDRIVCLLSDLMCGQKEFIGTPMELSEMIDPVGREPASRLSGHRHSRRPHSADLRGAAPHPSSAQSPFRSEHPAGEGIPNCTPLRHLSKRNPLRLAFVWSQQKSMEESA